MSSISPIINDLSDHGAEFLTIKNVYATTNRYPLKRRIRLIDNETSMNHGNETADPLAKKGTTLQNKQASLNFETIKRLIKQKPQEKFSQEAIAASSKTQWRNIKTTWENNKDKLRKQAVANFRLNTGHDCLAAHLHRIKILSHNYCTVC